MVIQLKPESLGRLQVRIVMDNHHLSVRMMAESPEAKQLIDHHAAQLKTDLQAQGIDMKELDVRFSNDAQRHSDPGFGESGKGMHRNAGRWRGNGTAAEAPPPAASEPEGSDPGDSSRLSILA
jgi:flagellar hook-length control protein FliK